MIKFSIRLVLALCCVGLLLLGQGAGAQSVDSGLYIDIKESEASGARVVERWKLYGSSHALVIGIDDYVGGWPKLRNAVRDARELADELERHGFQVTLKTDLDAGELRDTLRAFYALRGADPEARLLLWFAGHGQTINGEGFLVPADAPLTDDPLFKIKALHMRDFNGMMRLANSKHVLSVFDSCFSGTIFTARAGPTISNITHKTKEPVRQFITSGDAGQQVRDDGSFRKLFVRAIRGEELADANADGYVTGEELGLYLSQRMTNLTQAAQTPRYGRLQDVNFDQGDFVFQLPKRKAAAKPVGQDQQPTTRQGRKSDHDLAFWNAIKDSSAPRDYREYLARFPEGTFSGLAERRLAVLEKPQQAALTPATEPAPDFELEEMEAPYRVTTRANVRAGPATRFDKIDALASGQAVTVTGKVRGANWFRIAFGKGDQGFIFGQLIQDEASYQAAQAEVPQRSAGAVQQQAAASSAQRTAPTPSQAQVWASIQESTDWRDFQAYLDQFGEAGTYRGLAVARRNRLMAGQPQQQAALPPAGLVRYKGFWRGTMIPVNCPIATDVSSSYQLEMEIADGKISGRVTGAQGGKLSGQVDGDGTLRDLVVNFPEAIIRLQGKLGSYQGAGKWRAVGLRCRGLFKVSKR